MADVIDYRIIGDDMQIVEVELDPSEGVRAEAGAESASFQAGRQTDFGGSTPP